MRPRALRATVSSTPLLARITLASAVLALLVSAAIAILVLAILSLRNTTDTATRSKDVTAATLRLEKLVLDLETGLRGFVLAQNEHFLEPVSAARADLPGAIAAVEKLVAAEAAQRLRVEQLASLIREYVSDYVLPLIAIARQDPSAARASVARVEGKRRLDQIRNRFGQVLAVQDGIAARGVASAHQKASQAIELGFAALGVSALLVLLFGAYLVRSIARPVRAAAGAATQIAAGDLRIRLEEVGPGEIRELERAFNSMAESLGESKRELERQYEQLRESERLRTELLSIFSHELRTPLASVLGYTSLLLRRELDAETRRRYLEIVDGQSRRLAALVEDFLDAERLEGGRLELHEEVFDAGELLREQVQVYADETDRHHLDLALPPTPLYIRGDARRLAQVVGNLLGNAIKYSPDGGSIEISARRVGTQLRIEVRDRGIGIAPEHHSRIFTKFYRAEARASGIAGAGLGLAVARDIVEAHGGQIGFTSAEGAGSTFWVSLPGVAAHESGRTRAAG
jgi:signal transduction histidine kinase